MRCKACNARLNPSEIIWIRDRHDHEELCRKCRTEGDTSVLYQEDLLTEEDILDEYGEWD